jgi:hypothetical protein
MTRTSILYFYYGDETDKNSKERIMIGRVNENNNVLKFIRFNLSEEEKNIINDTVRLDFHNIFLEGIDYCCSCISNLEDLIKPYVNTYQFGRISRVLSLADRWRIDSCNRRKNASRIQLKWFCKPSDIKRQKQIFNTKHITIDLIGKYRMSVTKKRGKLIKNKNR